MENPRDGRHPNGANRFLRFLRSWRSWRTQFGECGITVNEQGGKRVGTTPGDLCVNLAL